MSAPPKPWEGFGGNSRLNTPLRSAITPRPSLPFGDRRNQLAGSSTISSGMDGSSSSKNPPPIPARPQRQRSSIGTGYGTQGGYGYGGYGSGMHGGYGGGMYGGGMYGGLGGYGGSYGGSYGGYSPYGSSGMNRFGAYGSGQEGSSSFVRRAEESSQAAFQSVESIVHAFGSIATMLESTHFAMFNSFRAVVGAADNFSRLKSHLLSALGAVTIFRTIHYLYRKLLAILGLSRSTGVEDELWNEAASSALVSSSGSGESKKSPRSWPIIMFFAVVMGVPWLIWKLLQSPSSEEDDSKDWMTGEGDHVLARAEFDFVGEGEEELSFSAGNIIRLAPKGKQPHIRGWLLATVDGERDGIVPANYVKILGLRRGKKSAGQDKASNGSVQEIPSEPSTSQQQQQQMTASSVDLISEFRETENEESILPSQNLQAETSFSGMDGVDFELPDENC